MVLSSVEVVENPSISTANVNFPVEGITTRHLQEGSTYNALTRILCAAMNKKVKLEFFDRTGIKHSIAIEGDFTLDKIRHLLDYAEIVAGSSLSTAATADAHDTKINRLLDAINTRLRDRPFDSREIWQVYREMWSDDFSLGAVSTYLSRLVDRGTLEREGSPSRWVYRIKPSPVPSQ